MKRTLLLSILLILISCRNSDELAILNFDQSSFDENRKLWNERKILNYTFSQESFSLSTGPQPKITCIVKNRVLDSTFVQFENNDNITPIESLNYYKTIEEAYNFIEKTVNSCKERIDSKENHMKGAKIDVEYDNNFYYPTKIYCIGYYKESFVGGLGIEITINGFEINK